MATDSIDKARRIFEAVFCDHDVTRTEVGYVDPEIERCWLAYVRAGALVDQLMPALRREAFKARFGH